MSPRTESTLRDHHVWLLALTLAALGLRLIRINSDLWLDEIAPLLEYGGMSTFEILGNYLRTSNHVLYTLMSKLMVQSFGESEWALRLPAVVFGTATIPVLYWVARVGGLARGASLAAGLLLAVSYHHIFFSQNARGYSAYLLFSLLSTGLMMRAAQTRSNADCLAYGAAAALSVFSLLLGVFVVASQLAILAAAALVSRAPSRTLTGTWWKRIALAAMGVAIGLVALNLRHLDRVQQNSASGYNLLDTDFWAEILRGVSAGFGTGGPLAILPVLFAAAFGFAILSRRSWMLSACLALPPFATAAFLVLSGLSLSPRFFLLLLPLAILSIVYAIDWWSEQIASARADAFPFRSRSASVLLAFIALASLIPLPEYYATPKQPYRASIEYLKATQQPGDLVIVVYLAEKGYRYYRSRLGLPEDENHVFVRSEADLEAALSGRQTGDVVLVTTFTRALQNRFPALAESIHNDWDIVRTFPATIGNGEISIWARRHARSTETTTRHLVSIRQHNQEETIR